MNDETKIFDIFMMIKNMKWTCVAHNMYRTDSRQTPKITQSTKESKRSGASENQVEKSEALE